MKTLVLLVVGLVLLVALAVTATGDDTVVLDIVVAPSTLLLGSSEGGLVAVHTDIAFGAVNTSSVRLDGIPTTRVKADNCGSFVGFFNEAKVKALVAPPEATLAMTGVTKDGTGFIGWDTVVVKNAR
jgi:hypothetical protein